jgi:hypothetical protein
MLNKAVRVQNKNVVSSLNRDFSIGTRSNPGIIHRIFNKVDTRTTAYGVAKFDPTVQLKDLKPLYTNEDQAEYNVTNLNNGFTVLTESQVFPGAVHMGFCMDVGTRDETAETSGALLAL